MMVEYIYSAKNNCFIESHRVAEYESFGWDLSDAKEVDEAIYLEFIQDRAVEGYRRMPGTDGLPVWEDLPPPTKEDLAKEAEKERQIRISDANAMINSKQWPSKLTLGRMSTKEKTQFNLWLDYLDALDAVDTSTAPDIDWPEKPA